MESGRHNKKMRLRTIQSHSDNKMEVIPRLEGEGLSTFQSSRISRGSGNDDDNHQANNNRRMYDEEMAVLMRTNNDEDESDDDEVDYSRDSLAAVRGSIGIANMLDDNEVSTHTSEDEENSDEAVGRSSQVGATPSNSGLEATPHFSHDVILSMPKDETSIHTPCLPDDDSNTSGCRITVPRSSDSVGSIPTEVEDYSRLRSISNAGATTTLETAAPCLSNEHYETDDEEQQAGAAILDVPRLSDNVPIPIGTMGYEYDIYDDDNEDINGNKRHANASSESSGLNNNESEVEEGEGEGETYGRLSSMSHQAVAGDDPAHFYDGSIATPVNEDLASLIMTATCVNVVQSSPSEPSSSSDQDEQQEETQSTSTKNEPPRSSFWRQHRRCLAIAALVPLLAIAVALILISRRQHQTDTGPIDITEVRFNSSSDWIEVEARFTQGK